MAFAAAPHPNPLPASGERGQVASGERDVLRNKNETHERIVFSARFACPVSGFTIDEIDPELRLIKGGGGALLREKIVAMASGRMVVIADHSKRVATLGAFPLPVEIVRFGATTTRNLIEALAAEAGCTGEMVLRVQPDGQPFVTDGGHLILDCAFGRIADPEALDEALKLVPGVVESGLFLGVADAAIVAGPDGVVVLDRDSEPQTG